MQFSLRFKFHLTPGNRIDKLQPARDQLQWIFQIICVLGKQLRVISVVHDAETQPAHMDSQLMLLAGDRREVKEAQIVLYAQ